uniref:Uncharacterized protein n=1 Tax=Arundo donax TaxID=35708 RepID=A0A0A9EE96_ARUDO
MCECFLNILSKFSGTNLVKKSCVQY